MVALLMKLLSSVGLSFLTKINWGNIFRWSNLGIAAALFVAYKVGAGCENKNKREEITRLDKIVIHKSERISKDSISLVKMQDKYVSDTNSLGQSVRIMVSQVKDLQVLTKSLVAAKKEAESKLANCQNTFKEAVDTGSIRVDTVINVKRKKFLGIF